MFKRCTLCDKTWKNQNDFLADPNILLIGYQANLKNPIHGLFLFTHSLKKCGTTFSVPVENFGNLYHGPIGTHDLNTLEDCPDYCLDQYNLLDCNVSDCKGSYVRKILQVLRDIDQKK